ncbi:hypothetical protein OIU34_20435 [Pararhizobium sp. BT-229]|nr:hypothetical protein [Pararhizobium sp. BT-229]MCV9964257.1 hypothetical protein [Pararhizobium sp. BT-229]
MSVTRQLVVRRIRSWFSFVSHDLSSFDLLTGIVILLLASTGLPVGGRS